MIACWNMSPSLRPTFKAIEANLMGAYGVLTSPSGRSKQPIRRVVKRPASENSPADAPDYEAIEDDEAVYEGTEPGSPMYEGTGPGSPLYEGAEPVYEGTTPTPGQAIASDQYEVPVVRTYDQPMLQAVYDNVSDIGVDAQYDQNGSIVVKKNRSLTADSPAVTWWRETQLPLKIGLDKTKPSPSLLPWYVPLSSLSSHLNRFHGRLTRDSATIRLKENPGTFLIHLTVPQAYALSYSTPAGNVRHLEITAQDGQYFVQQSKQGFPTLEALVAHFKRQPIDKNGNVLLVPCADMASNGQALFSKQLHVQLSNDYDALDGYDLTYYGRELEELGEA